MSEFKVGMKVVCVDDAPEESSVWEAGAAPKLRAIYTITGLFIDPLDDALCLQLLEISRRGSNGTVPGYASYRFRPVETKSAAMELFRAIAAGKHIVPDDEPIHVSAPKEGWTVETLTADILRRGAE